MTTRPNTPEHSYSLPVQTSTENLSNTEVPQTIQQTTSEVAQVETEVAIDVVWEEAQGYRNNVERATDADVNLMSFSWSLQSSIDSVVTKQSWKEQLRWSEMMRQYQQLWSQYIWMYLPTLSGRAKQSMVTAWATMFMERVSLQETKDTTDSTSTFLAELFSIDTKKSWASLLYNLFSLTQWNKDYPEFFLYANQSFRLINTAITKASPLPDLNTLSVINNPVEQISRVESLKSTYRTSKELEALDEDKKKEILQSLISHSWSLKLTQEQRTLMQQKYSKLAADYNQVQHTWFQWFLKLWKNVLERIENNKHHLTKMSWTISFLCSLPYVWDTFKDWLDPVFAIHGWYDKYIQASILEFSTLKWKTKKKYKKYMKLYKEALEDESQDKSFVDELRWRYEISWWLNNSLNKFSYTKFLLVLKKSKDWPRDSKKKIDGITLPKNSWKVLGKDYLISWKKVTDENWDIISGMWKVAAKHIFMIILSNLSQNQGLVQKVSEDEYKWLWWDISARLLGIYLLNSSLQESVHKRQVTVAHVEQDNVLEQIVHENTDSQWWVDDSVMWAEWKISQCSIMARKTLKNFTWMPYLQNEFRQWTIPKWHAITLIKNWLWAWKLQEAFGHHNSSWEQRLEEFTKLLDKRRNSWNISENVFDIYFHTQFEWNVLPADQYSQWHRCVIVYRKWKYQVWDPSRDGTFWKWTFTDLYAYFDRNISNRKLTLWKGSKTVNGKKYSTKPTRVYVSTLKNIPVSNSTIELQPLTLEAKSIPQHTINYIKKFEWYSNVAYPDSIGVRTIWYWSTKINGSPVTQWMKITQKQAEHLMRYDILRHQKRKSKIDWPYPEWLETALTSFEYNLWWNIRNTTAKWVIPAIKSWNYTAAWKIMLGHDHAWKKRLPWLTKRRKEEVAMLKGSVSYA